MKTWLLTEWKKQIRIGVRRSCSGHLREDVLSVCPISQFS